jgi:NADH-quinone oxidoreductase subunit G
MDRGHSISTCISKAVDNEFSGNMIDVCPVGALLIKHSDLNQSLVQQTYNAHRLAQGCCGKTTLDVWNEIQRVQERKDLP